MLDPFCLAEEDLALATDLYQLTMAAAYHGLEERPRASFEYFVRRLPPRRSFLVFAGLEQALAALARLHFKPAQIEYLRGLPQFARVGDSFFEELAAFAFRAELWSLAEGTVFFPNEPVLRVTGDLLEAQVVETLLLSILNFQSLVASKAARIRLAAGEEVSLSEFGTRRAHGPQAGAWVARAAYLAGFDATSNVLAGQKLGIPVSGTMAHSFVLSFDREEDAFRHYQRLFPQHTTHLVDTYDTLEGVRRALATGEPFQAVRLDSGDLLELSKQARRILDEGGRPEAKIFASGDADEDLIAELRAAGAPIDAWGVGTRLASVADGPYLPGVYKLVEIERPRDGGGVVRLGRAKRSAGKATLPGRKQILRRSDEGRMRADRILPAEHAEADRRADEEPLLRLVMREGELQEPAEFYHLETARERCRHQLAALPESLRRLDPPAEPYPVAVDPRLEAGP